MCGWLDHCHCGGIWPCYTAVHKSLSVDSSWSLAYITSQPSWYEIEDEEIYWILKSIVCPIKTIRRSDNLPTLAAKYTHAQNVFPLLTRVERSRSIVIIKHKYMLMCNHKIHAPKHNVIFMKQYRCEQSFSNTAWNRSILGTSTKYSVVIHFSLTELLLRTWR